MTSSTSSGRVSQPTTADASRAASIDVCSLLTEADAADVEASSHPGAAGDTYKLTATKVVDTSPIPDSACKFSFSTYSAGTLVSSGVIEVDVRSAQYFAPYKDGGKLIPGLGDEAVSTSGLVVVRVGDLMMQAGGHQFVIDLFRKMVPKLK